VAGLFAQLHLGFVQVPGAVGEPIPIVPLRPVHTLLGSRHGRRSGVPNLLNARELRQCRIMLAAPQIEHLGGAELESFHDGARGYSVSSADNASAKPHNVSAG